MNQLIAIGDDVEFELRLTETIAWCVARADTADPKNSLRYDGWSPNILDRDRISIVNSVVKTRSPGRSRSNLRPVQSIADLKGGKIMVYFPDQELADGAAEQASRGFFDIHNAPPWDTWIGLLPYDGPFSSENEPYLAAYVPESLIKDASQGIEANPEQCIMWLRDSQTGLRNHFRERGLLT